MIRQELVSLGRVVGTHGVRGEIKILSYAESLNIFRGISRVFLKQEGGRVETKKVISVRFHKGLVLMRLKDILSRDEAQLLMDAQVCVSKNDLRECGEGEYYWFDIMGLKVYTEKGTYLGEVKEILPTGTNDVYVVSEGRDEYLVPAISQCVRKVDLKKGTMVVRPLPGLWDLNDI